MRNHLVAELEKLAQKDERICLFTGDLGFGVLDNFAKLFPDRFFNAGISEQNMTTVACGMALEGNIAYTYSIGNFPGVRCLEQIRNDICYHNANVKIIVVGGGFAYGQLGMSHHATEDLAMMRALPNMHVFCPSDAKEAVEVLRLANGIDGPCYIRLAKGKEPDLHADGARLDVRKIDTIQTGGKTAVISTGPILGEVLKAAANLEKDGIKIGIYNVVSIKPIDNLSIEKIAKEYEHIISLEEHNVMGGLGGVISEVIADMQGERAQLTRMGLQDVYTSIVGSQEYLREYYGMSAQSIVNKVIEMER